MNNLKVTIAMIKEKYTNDSDNASKVLSVQAVPDFININIIHTFIEDEKPWNTEEVKVSHSGILNTYDGTIIDTSITPPDKYDELGNGGCPVKTEISIDGLSETFVFKTVLDDDSMKLDSSSVDLIFEITSKAIINRTLNKTQDIADEYEELVKEAASFSYYNNEQPLIIMEKLNVPINMYSKINDLIDTLEYYYIESNI